MRVFVDAERLDDENVAICIRAGAHRRLQVLNSSHQLTTGICEDPNERSVDYVEKVPAFRVGQDPRSIGVPRNLRALRYRAWPTEGRLRSAAANQNCGGRANR
jgi:hypothetical protein